MPRLPRDSAGVGPLLPSKGRESSLTHFLLTGCFAGLGVDAGTPESRGFAREIYGGNLPHSHRPMTRSRPSWLPSRVES